MLPLLLPGALGGTFTPPPAQAPYSGTLYAYDTASPTLPSAATFITAGGGSSNTNRSTTIGTNTGWGIINALASGPAWAAAGSAPAPTGYGILWDVTTLEGQSLLAGNWQPTSKLKVSVGSITATLVWRICVYHGWSGLITVLGSTTLSAQTIGTAYATYLAPVVALARIPFGIGDKLFVDLSANITSNSTGSSVATLFWTDFAHNGTGFSTNSFTAPLYQPFGQPAVAAPLSQPYAATSVQLGGPYVQADGSKLSYDGTDLDHLYGATFYPATEGGSPAWRLSSMTTVIDAVIAGFTSAKMTLIRPTDQWGSPTLGLNWDDPVIWANMDYLITQAYAHNVWVILELSGWKSWLTYFGYNPIDSIFWLPLIAAVGAHYQLVPHIAWYAISGEPSYPTSTATENALITYSDVVTRAMYTADEGHHLINAGSYNHMPDGLQTPPWWEAIWALPYNTLCSFKCYSLGDLNGLATWAQYGSQTLKKPTVMGEFGVPFSSGDGTYTGTPFNNLTTDRADFFQNVFTIGEANGICAFAFWNYDHGNASASYDTDPNIAPSTWAVVRQHTQAHFQPFIPDLRPSTLSPLGVLGLCDSLARHIRDLSALVGATSAIVAGQQTLLNRIAALNDAGQIALLMDAFEFSVNQEQGWIAQRQNYQTILDLFLPAIAALDLTTEGLALFLQSNNLQVDPYFGDAFQRAASFLYRFPQLPLKAASIFGPAISNMGGFTVTGAGTGTFTAGSTVPAAYGNAPLSLTLTANTGASVGTYTVSFTSFDFHGNVSSGTAQVTIPGSSTIGTIFSLNASGTAITNIAISGGTTGDSVKTQSALLRTLVMSYRSEVLADYPLAYLRLNETSGTIAYDSSGNGRNGSYHGAITLNQPGATSDGDAAITVGPAGSYVSVPTTGFPTGAAAWSVEGLIYLAAGYPGNDPGLLAQFGNWGTSHQSAFLGVHNSGIPTITVFSQDINGITALSKSTWHHLIGTYDGTTVCLYVDGTLVNSAAATVNIVLSSASIGELPSGVNAIANGTSVDEIAFYSTALSASRVLTHYQASIGIEFGS